MYYTKQTVRQIKLKDINEREKVGLLTPTEAAELRRRV